MTRQLMTRRTVQPPLPLNVRGGFDESERAWLRLALAEGTPVPAILDPYTGTAAA